MQLEPSDSDSIESSYKKAKVESFMQKDASCVKGKDYCIRNTALFRTQESFWMKELEGWPYLVVWPAPPNDMM